jgi:membrane protein DedA with SNARE-associated domain
MSPEALLHKFGYLAVFVGTFLEGETILVMAGFFAQRGYLELLLVILTAFLGAFIGHVFWFWVGRTKGVKVLDRFPKMSRHFGKGVRMFERYGAPAIFFTQYLYGLRITCAIIIGVSKISTIKFLIYEALSCIIWAGIIATLGFYFGRVVERVLGRAAHVEKYGLIALVVVGAAVYGYHQWRDRREAKAPTPS